MSRARVTLQDVARTVGVHASTVSRVMNPETRGMVTAALAEKVLGVADELGFLPNGIASSLRTRRSFTIGVVIPDITNPVFPPILRGIEDALVEPGYIPMVANAPGGPEQQQRVVDRLLARQVDGLILATVALDDPVLDRCLAAGVPVVLVNRGAAGERVSSVVSDEQLGMRLGVAHLAELGHRRIGHLGGPLRVSTGLLRRDGFVAAMLAHGLATAEVAGDWSVFADAYERPAGRIAAAELLRRHPDITAISCANDLLALGCYDALADAGLSCPGDVSVVGHNDMPLVDSVAPALTTIRIKHHQMGTEAAELLLSAMRGEAPRPTEIRLQPTLVVRASTARHAKVN